MCTQGPGGTFSHIGNNTQFDLDFDTPNNVEVPIVAAASGKVYLHPDTGPRGYGNHINIDHGDGYFSLYAHLKKFLVADGERVVRGQVIGIDNSTGFSTGDHLHFGLHVGDASLDAIGSTSIIADRLIARDIGGETEFVELRSTQFRCGVPGGGTYISNNVELTSQPVLTISSGDGQIGTTGAVLPNAIAVRTADGSGNPLGAISVTFAVSSGGGCLSTQPDGSGCQQVIDLRTNENAGTLTGIAGLFWHLGSFVGVQSVAVSSPGVTPVTFTAIALALPPPSPSTLSLFGGDGQSATSGEYLPTPIYARVADGNGNPIGSVPVTFRVMSGGGCLASLPGAVDCDQAITRFSFGDAAGAFAGVADAAWKLGPGAGIQSIEASSPGLSPVTFTATALPPTTPTCPDLFVDDFNRPDGAVGNGWLGTTGGPRNVLVLRAGVLTTPLPPSGIESSIYRPIDVSSSTTVTATLTEMNGFGGLLRRYGHTIAYGALPDGTGGAWVAFVRGDQNYSDSRVVVNGVPLYSPFQFGASIAVSLTFRPDGSVSGSARSDGQTFLFSSGPTGVTLTGSFLVITLGDPDSRSGIITAPTVDDVSIRACAEILGDDFDDGVLDPTIWRVQGGIVGTVSETNQRLEMNPTGPSGTGVGIISTCSVTGDFDVQVDFNLLTWPDGFFKNVQLRAVDLGGPAGPASMARNGWGDFYVLSLADRYFLTPTNDLSGSLRLVRTGSTLSGYFLSGGTWVLVNAGEVPTTSTRFSLESGGAGPFSLAFDNFQVSAGALSCQ